VHGDGGAPEITVNDDPFSHKPLPGVARLPLAITLYKVSVQSGSEWILDATSEEEQCSSVRLTLSLSPEGRLCGVSKAGVGTLQLAALEAIMAHAAALGVQLNKLIRDEVRRATGADVEKEEEGKGAKTQQHTPALAPVPVGADAADKGSKSGKSTSSKKKKPLKQQQQQQAMAD